MLMSNDNETSEKFCKPLVMLTPLEYDKLFTEIGIKGLVKYFQDRHCISVKAIAIRTDGDIEIDWEDIK